MPNWSGLILTKQGRELQAKVEAGTQLALTKFKLGSGVLPSGKQLEELTDLVAPEQNVGIATIEALDDGTCRVSATISNVGLEVGYNVRELGVYATDPDKGEILYLVATDSAPDYLPAAGGATAVSQEFAVYVSANNTENVVAKIDAGALATMGYVQLLFDKQLKLHNTDAAAHAAAIEAHNEAADAHQSNFATQAEAETGTNENKFMSPVRVAQAIKALASLQNLGVNASAGEINQLVGVSSNVQQQIDNLKYLITIPSWWLERGDDSDGDFNPQNNVTISGTKNYKNINIPAGVTVTAASGTRLYCTGNFVNQGTITVNTVNKAGAGGTGGIDGSGEYNGTPATAGGNSTNDYIVSNGGNGGAGGNGHKYNYGNAAGGASVGTIVSTKNEIIVSACGGSGGGGGGGGFHGGTQYQNGSAGGAGGAGGGVLLITCASFANNGTISADGADGANGKSDGASPGGGGGGGGGGAVLVITDAVKTQGTITVSGGKGGKVTATVYDPVDGEDGQDGIIMVKGLEMIK